MRRALVCFFCMIISASLSLQTAPTAEIALQSSRKLPAKKSAFSFSWKKAVIITIPLLLYWKWRAIRSFFEEAAESSVPTATAGSTAVVPNELLVPEDADGGVDIDRVVSTLAPRLNPAEIKKMLENDLRSPKQAGMTCGAYAIANVLTAYGFSVGPEPLDPTKSFHDNAKYNAEVIIKLLQKQSNANVTAAEHDLEVSLRAKQDFDTFIEAFRSSDQSLASLRSFLEGPGKRFDPLHVDIDRQAAYNALNNLTQDAAELERFKVTFLLEAIQTKTLPAFTESLEKCKQRIQEAKQALNGSLDPSEDTYVQALKTYNPALAEVAPLAIFTAEGLKSQSTQNAPPDAIVGALFMAPTMAEGGCEIPPGLLPAEDLAKSMEIIQLKHKQEFLQDVKNLQHIINSTSFKQAYRAAVLTEIPADCQDLKSALLDQSQTQFSADDAGTLLQDFDRGSLNYLGMPANARQAVFHQQAQVFATAGDTEKAALITRLARDLSHDSCAKQLNYERSLINSTKLTPLGFTNYSVILQSLLDMKSGKPGAFVIRKPGHYVAAVVKDGDIVLLDSNSGTGRNSLDPVIEQNLKNYFFAPRA